MRFAKFFALAGILVTTGGCSNGPGSEPQDLPELGTQQQALTCSGASSDSCILTTYDGYAIFRDTCSDNGSFYTTDTTADACCTAGTSGCKYTGLRWQCVEWARRYTWKKWGPVWPGVTGATDMCGSHPTGTTIVSKPVPGDVVVYGPGACLQKSSTGSCLAKAHATYGHVGVVMGNPSTTKDRVKDQNAAQKSYNDYLKSAVQCYVHATNNPRTCFAGATKTITDTTCASGSATQTCTASDTWSEKTCVPAAVDCTNDVIEGSEVCSGTNLDGKTCVTQGFAGGTLSCKCVNNIASFDTSQCYECDDGGACDPDGGDSDSGAVSGGGGSSTGGGWSTGGAHTGGSSGSGATPSATGGSGATSSQKTRLESGDDGGCSVGSSDGESSSALLWVMGLGLALAARRARFGPACPRKRVTRVTSSTRFSRLE